MRYYLSTDKHKRTFSDWPTMLSTLIICLLCWIAGYYSSLGFPLTTDHTVLPFIETIYQWVESKLLTYIIGISLLLFMAFIIQRICDIEMLISERTRLVFLFFVLLMSTHAGLLPFKEVTLVLLCMVLVIYALFNVYQQPEATGKMFNAGVYLGIAGLFMPQALWFVPLLWMGMYQFLTLSYRSFVASLLGVLTIYWIVLGWCVWTHDYSMFTLIYSSLKEVDFLSVFLSFRYYQLGFFIVLLLVFVAFFHIKMDAMNNRVRVRQMLSFLIYMSIWSLALVCIYSADADAFIVLFYLPVSIIMAYFFENLKARFRFLLFYLVLAINAFSFMLRLWNY